MDDPITTPHSPYERPPRRALSEMTPETKAAWLTRYLTDAVAEFRVQAVLERAKSAMRAADAETTIRTLWVMLSDRYVRDGDPDIGAAAAQAGMALGITAT